MPTPILSTLIARRLDRRAVLAGLGASAAIAAAGVRPAQGTPAGAAFTEVSHGVDTTHHVAPGH